MLRLAALFHDIEKPGTRTVAVDGRIGFMGHDRGRRNRRAVLERWRASTSPIRFCALLVAEHLRLGFWCAIGRSTAAPATATCGRPSRTRTRASCCRWPTGLPPAACAPARPPGARRDGGRAGRADAELSARPRRRCFAATRSPSHRCHGAAIGELVEALAEEQAAGAVTTREEAVAYVRG